MKKEIEAFVNAANEQELEAAWNNLSAEEQRVFEQLMEEDSPEDALAFFAQLYDDTPKEQASETVSISENEIYFKRQPLTEEQKALANQARKEAVNMKGIQKSPDAAEKYRAEVESINAKLNAVIGNKPKERRATIIANENIKAKVQAQGLDYKKDKKEIKKIAAVEMQRARDSVGASGSKTKITFTDREWEAVQAGAISDSKLMKILNSSKSDEIIKRAMPKASTTLSSAKLGKAQAMLANGYSYAEIAKACGVPESTIYDNLNK